MQFLLLICTDDGMLDAQPEGEFDKRMNHCFRHTDALQAEGKLIESQQLEEVSSAKGVRIATAKSA